MVAHVGLAIEQALGHVAYGMSLRRVLTARTDLACDWLEVPYETGQIGRIPVLGANWTVRGSLRARTAIGRLHRQQPLDALFIHTQTISLFSADLMAKIPTLLSLDATPINYDELATSYGDRVHSPLVERAKLGLHRSVMRRARWFTTWSEWAKRSLVRDYGADPERVTVVHPGTDLTNFPDPKLRAPRREGPLRILFVGGDFVRKGGDLLLKVAAELGSSVELHLVTSVQLPKTDGVFVYRGMKPHSPELLERYRQADVFVLPTRGDCLAVVLGEAMASCLPIITTRVGAHAEAVEDGDSGFVIDVDDAVALRDRIQRFVQDRDLAFRMGMRSRQVGEQRFDMHKNAGRIGDLLSTLASERRV